MDWRELCADRAVLDTIARACEIGSRGRYGPADSLAREDLNSWALVEAVRIARWFAEQHPDADADRYRAMLHVVLVTQIQRGDHLRSLFHYHGAFRFATSLDAELPGTNGLTPGSTLAGYEDPERIIIRRETLEHLLERAETEQHQAPTGCIECGKPILFLGLCTLHYNKVKRARKPICSADNCERISHARGLCRKHWEHDKENPS